MSDSGEDDQPCRLLLGYQRKKKTTSRPRSPVMRTPSTTTSAVAGTPPGVTVPPPPTTLNQIQDSPHHAYTVPFYPYSQPPLQYYQQFTPPPGYQYQYPQPPPGYQLVYQPVPTPSTQQTASSGTSNSRLRTELEGDTFHPSQQSVHRIVEIIRAMYDASHISWKKIPQEVRDLMFKEFEKDFTWDPKHAKQIRKNFEHQASACMSDMFGDMRKCDQRAAWLEKSLWDELNKVWGTADYIQRSAQSKVNRASDVGGSKTLERQPTTLELHKRTHKCQHDEEWVDTRVQRAAEEYVKLKEARSKNIATKGSSEKPSDFDILYEAVGERKKSRVYELGAEGAAYEARSSRTSDQDSQLYKMERLKQHIQLQLDEHAAQMNAQMAVLRAQLDKLEQEHGKGKGPADQEPNAEDTDSD